MSDLALALDQTDKASFWSAVNSLPQDPNLVLKIGLRLLPLLGADDFLKLKSKGHKLFIDVKLHDIPSQTADAVKTWAALGASFVTVHLSGGREMLLQAQAAAAESKIKLLGVSILTSLDASDLKEIGFTNDVSAQVNKLIDLGVDCGLNGFVCSPFEVESVLKNHPKAFLVTPGISIDESMEGVGSDQKRRRSFKEALDAGSSMPVVGRSLWQAPNFLETLNNLLEQSRS